MDKRKLNMDVTRAGVLHRLFVKVGDTNSRTVEVSFHSQGEPITFDTCSIRAKLPNGTERFANCSVKDNVATYTFTTDDLASQGAFLCEFVLTSAGATLTSPEIEVVVTDILFGGEGIEGSNEYQAYLAALQKLEALSASAVSLNEGEEATAEIVSTETTLGITFGIPRGGKGDKGDPGDKGDKGDPGADGYSLNPRGEFYENDWYMVDDIVSYDGSLYICTARNGTGENPISAPPVDPDCWMLAVQKPQNLRVLNIQSHFGTDMFAENTIYIYARTIQAGDESVVRYIPLQSAVTGDPGVGGTITFYGYDYEDNVKIKGTCSYLTGGEPSPVEWTILPGLDAKSVIGLSAEANRHNRDMVLTQDGKEVGRVTAAGQKNGQSWLFTDYSNSDISGDFSSGFGYNNQIFGNGNAVFGIGNRLTGRGVVLSGVGNTVLRCAEGAMICGKNLYINDPTIIFAAGAGQSSMFWIKTDGTYGTSGGANT